MGGWGWGKRNHSSGVKPLPKSLLRATEGKWDICIRPTEQDHLLSEVCDSVLFCFVGEGEESHASGALVRLVCSVFLGISSYLCRRFGSCALLLFGCAVGINHLPAHRGVFRSVSQCPHWRISDRRVRTRLWWIKHCDSCAKDSRRNVQLSIGFVNSAPFEGS